jgi:beta-lactamase regulating signal transducer with metallopeptidase domain
MSMLTPILQFGTVKLLRVRGEIHEAFTSLLFPQFNYITTDAVAIPSGLEISKVTIPVSQNSDLHWSFWVVLIWFAGAFLFSLRIIIGKFALWHIIKDIQTYKAKKYTAIVKQISEKLGISKKIDLLISAKCKLPFTSNVFNPIILIPSDAVNWPLERLRVVLTHELIHIKRMDYLTQFVSRIICSIFWFLPLIWIAYSCLYMEQEKACDSFVIETGIKPASYAGHIVYLARLGGKPILIAGIFISKRRKDMLEKRILNVVSLKRTNLFSKGGKKMKTKKLIIIATLILAFIVLIAGCATSKKAYVSGEYVLEALSGTWINEDYNDPSILPMPKVIVSLDGTYGYYKQFPDVDNVTYNAGEFIMKDTWTDPDGNIWYKARCEEDWTTDLLYELGKISSSGRVWEYVWSSIDYPTEIDSTNLNYRIRYLQ